jgi:hypothetical protein
MRALPSFYGPQVKLTRLYERTSRGEQVLPSPPLRSSRQSLKLVNVRAPARPISPRRLMRVRSELDAFRVKRRLRTGTEGKDAFFEGVRLAS